MFNGFLPPTENWSKLPNELIDELSSIDSLAEMKVILYVLRHTWGYKDDWKKITIDEFCSGRKRKDGTRIDNGTGMTEPAIRSGIEKAIEHGFLVVEIDDTDKGRIRKYYSLNSQGEKDLPPERKDFTPREKKVLPRTEKDTLRKKPKKKTIEATPLPPAITAYRSIAKRYPDKATWPLIELTVGTEQANLDFWEQVVTQYIACGWNKTNVAGMLDFYRQRKIPSTQPINGRNNHNGTSNFGRNNQSGTKPNGRTIPNSCGLGELAIPPTPGEPNPAGA